MIITKFGVFIALYDRIVIPASEIAQSDWLFTAQHYVVLVSSDIVSIVTECEKENVLQSPQQAHLNQTTTDFSIDLSTEDDDFLSHTPSSMLSRNSVMSSLKCNQPIFYICSVMINYNDYNHECFFIAS